MPVLGSTAVQINPLREKEAHGMLNITGTTPDLAVAPSRLAGGVRG
jgi:hypothetical protein